MRLVVPEMAGDEYQSREEVWDLYGMDPRFDLEFLPTSLRSGASAWRVMAPLLRGHLRLARGDWRSHQDDMLLISKSTSLLTPYLLTRCAAAGRRLILPWLHSFVDRRRERLVHRLVDGILVTNSALARAVREDTGVAPERFFVTGNPLREERLAHGRSASRRELRQRFGLDPDRPLVVYSGKLYLGMRELDYLLEAASAIPECEFLFTGGKPHVADAVRKQAAARRMTNLRLTGFLERVQDVWEYQAAADLLVAYYSDRDHSATKCELPNKVGEYMSTGNPVIAADLPPVRDLLNESNAYLVPPDHPEEMVAAIRRALSDPEERLRKGRAAAASVADYTFTRAAPRLLEFARDLAEHGGRRRRSGKIASEEASVP